MFYQQEPETVLRFGDVVEGYVSTTPAIQKPVLGGKSDDYTVSICLPLYSIVMTPCCSIGDKTISLTPLLKVRGSFFNNPYLAEDLIRINRRMYPQQTVSPQIWGTLPLEEKQRRLEEGFAYAFVDLFVYEKHKLLPEYELPQRQASNIITSYYMIDFRFTYKLNCDQIQSPEDSPLESKRLQVSLETRDELRQKLAAYYLRTPREDKVLQSL